MGFHFQLKDAHLPAIAAEKDPDLFEIFSSSLALNEVSAFLKQPAAPFHRGAQHRTTLLFLHVVYCMLGSLANLPCGHSKQ